jgi:hypothetical protein
MGGSSIAGVWKQQLVSPTLVLLSGISHVSKQYGRSSHRVSICIGEETAGFICFSGVGKL